MSRMLRRMGVRKWVARLLEVAVKGKVSSCSNHSMSRSWTLSTVTRKWKLPVCILCMGLWTKNQLLKRYTENGIRRQSWRIAKRSSIFSGSCSKMNRSMLASEVDICKGWSCCEGSCKTYIWGKIYYNQKWGNHRESISVHPLRNSSVYVSDSCIKSM